jgi:hypothetical protein
MSKTVRCNVCLTLYLDRNGRCPHGCDPALARDRRRRSSSRDAKRERAAAGLPRAFEALS